MSEVSLGQLYEQFQREDEITTLDAGPVELEVLRASVRNENAIFPTFRVASGPNTGKTVMAGQLTLTEKSRSIFFRQLAGFGIGQEFFAAYANLPLKDALQQIANALVGRVVLVDIQKQPYQGEDRNKLPIGGIKLVRVNQGAPAGAPIAQAPPAAPIPTAAPPAPTPPAAQVAQAPPAPVQAPNVPPPVQPVTGQDQGGTQPANETQATPAPEVVAPVAAPPAPPAPVADPAPAAAAPGPPLPPPPPGAGARPF